MFPHLLILILILFIDCQGFVGSIYLPQPRPSSLVGIFGDLPYSLRGIDTSQMTRIAVINCLLQMKQVGGSSQLRLYLLFGASTVFPRSRVRGTTTALQRSAWLEGNRPRRAFRYFQHLPS